MDTGAASNEVQQGCPLPTLPSGQIPWNNVTSPSENAEREAESHLPLYYNTPSNGNHPANTSSSFPSSQEAPTAALTYQADSERYQQQNSSLQPRMNPPGPGLFQPNTTWSGHFPRGQPHIPSDHTKAIGQASTNTSKAFSFQPPGKSVTSSWFQPNYISSYPTYGNDGHRKKPYSLPDVKEPVESSSSNGLTQHQHMPIPSPNLQYAHNNTTQSNESRTGNFLNKEMRHSTSAGPSERGMYPTLPNTPSTSYYIPQAPYTPRHPNTVQFSHPMGPNPKHPVVSPYSINPPATGHGRGKNRANKSYQCPKCAKVFRRGDHLKRHLLSVHDHEHPYQCGDCGKGFASVTALLKHAKSLHVGNLAKGLMCLRCQLTFMSMKEIESHANSLHVQEDETYMQNINTSSKQHTCITCSKTFTSAAHLKRHMQLNHRSKDDSKIFCRECGKSFARIDALRKHIDKTHNGNPNALPPDDLDDADNTRQSTFSEGDSRGPSADNDESSVSSQSSVSTQWIPRPSSQPPSDQARPNSTISNAQIVPSSVLYQQVPGVQRQPQVTVDTKGQQVPGLMTNPENHSLAPALPVLPPHNMPPRKDSDVKVGQNSRIAVAQHGNNATVTMEEVTSGKNQINDSRARRIHEQTVSEAFSMAMRTLSEFDYESAEELLPHSFDAALPQPSVPYNRNGFLSGSHYPTNGAASDSAALGIAPTAVPPEMHHLNGNKYYLSSRPQRNFLMTMPPPPVATMGCLPTRMGMAPGMVQVPHRLSLLHQGGGGGVKIPITNPNKNIPASIVNQTTMQKMINCEDISIDKILSDLRTSSKSITAQSQADNSQENVDLSCAVCKTQYNSIDDLMTHIEGVHLRANPHECCICKKHFAQAGNVKRHIRFVHLRERPFRCKDCSCTFDRLCYLQRHMRTHLQWNEENQEFNPLKPCFCPECGKRCLTAHHLRGHMQRKHFAKNKQNYSEFLAKYGHLEALGNGPGALVSQRGRRGRRKKNANVVAISNVNNCITAGRDITGTTPNSSLISYSSNKSQPLLQHADHQFSSLLSNNKNLQRSLPISHKSQPHSLQSNILQSTMHQFLSYSHNAEQESHSANLPITTQPKTVEMFNFHVQQQDFVQDSKSQSCHSSYGYPQGYVDHRNAIDKPVENKAKGTETILQKRTFCSKLKKKLLSFKCSYCVVKYFYSSEMLRSHVTLCHRNALKRYVCCKCGASFAKHKLLVGHKTKFHSGNACLLSRMKPSTNDRVRFSVNVNSLAIDSPTQTTLLNKHYSMQMHQPHQRSFGSVTTQMNFFSYDPNSPAMVPSPNVDTMYRNPSHHINTSMPLIQT